MKSVIRIFALTMLMTSIAALAQTPAPAPAPAKADAVIPKPPYDSVHAQLACEKEKNLQYQFAQMQEQMKEKTQELQQQYQQQEGFLTNWIASVRAANKWDDSYVYDRDTDSWSHQVKPSPPAAKPATKK